MSASNQDSQNTNIPREESSQLPATSQGYVLPEGKIMPNTIFVGGIDIRMDETEIQGFFTRYGTVKEVKIITDRTGVSKGYGFVSFLDNVDVQKIVESQINFHGKKLKLGPAIRKHPNLCAYHVPPRPMLINSPTPQFHSVWSNQETYMQSPAVMSPVTQYVQIVKLAGAGLSNGNSTVLQHLNFDPGFSVAADKPIVLTAKTSHRPIFHDSQAYPYGSPALLIQQQVPVGYQPTYNYQIPPQWPPGEPRNYIVPAYTTVNYGSEMDVGTDQAECSMTDTAQSSANSPQKKSVDRSIQTVVSCLCNPDNRLRNNIVTQEDYLKEKRAHHFRRSRAVLKTV